MFLVSEHYFGRRKMKKYSVLLVDDHQILIEGIRNLINTSERFEVMDIASDLTKALELLKSNEYNVLITDYEMPGITGAELIRIAHSVAPEIKVIVLSMHDDMSVIRELLQLEIEAFVLKTDTHQSIMEALESAVQGKKYFSQEITKMLIADKRDVQAESTLSPREIEILRLIVKEYTTRQIAEILGISERTVETHRKNMIKKSNSPNLVALIKYAYSKKLV